MLHQGKIINDPVYGFLRFPEPELMRIIDHPWFQRLRHIKQMGLAHYVYPGAVHTRFHHSLGACYLMGQALEVLKTKGIKLTQDECLAARIAILLHDVGHGPYSHSLEHILADGISHEFLSHIIMQELNKKMDGMLKEALQIFDQSYPTKYLHQLVSSQLDVDRMDYLNRDSFYTGVSEGVIGYDRILQMLNVYNNELMVEEKGVHSVEKFIIARRLMYSQVYLHKTVLGAEEMLIKILTRAKELAAEGQELFATPALSWFLHKKFTKEDFIQDPQNLQWFCMLDDNDIMASVKVWQQHPDFVLSTLCRMLVNRHLYKVAFNPSLNLYTEKKEQILNIKKINEENLHYFLFEGKTSTSTYNVNNERIQILMKSGKTIDISDIDNALVNESLAMPVHKKYICYVFADSLK